jgi:hypothetical protein
MYEHNLHSLRYLCTFSYSKNNSKFTGPLLKIYVCDVIKTLLSMKVKYVYGIHNRKYTGGAVQEKKAWNTVQIISCQFYLYMNVISVLCNPNGTLFQTCLILHVWLKSIVLVFATLVSFTNYIPPPLPYFKVNIYPLPLPHFASICFAYLWSFHWPNYIVTLSRYVSFRLPHLNISTQKNWTIIVSERGLVKI